MSSHVLHQVSRSRLGLSVVAGSVEVGWRGLRFREREGRRGGGSKVGREIML
jgi:hypothetical protein